MRPRPAPLAARSLVALLGALLGAAGCGRADGGEPDGHGGTLVVGTVLEAATGEPLAGVQITGPGAARAVSDARGRFSLTVEGPGTLQAEGRDGLRASNPLQSLHGDRLEVVLHLR